MPCGLCKHALEAKKTGSHKNRCSTIDNYMACGPNGTSVSHRQFKHTLTLPLVLVLYEYLITFPDEICVVWERPWTLGSVLLLSVRWNMVVNSFLDLIPLVAQFSIAIFCNEG